MVSAWSTSAYRSGEESLTVDTIDIRSLIDEYELSDIAIIVDIEGAEAELVTYELDVLAEQCEVLVIEFHDESESIDSAQRQNIRRAREELLHSSFEQVFERQKTVVFEQKDG